ncbi:hypothetical protein BV22DRAFT_1036813 [Leucogyrophana mollusca]|uniref:Uncharacterized protein n=1 Tax=Leucogyrophana mollusca TaxID=85980 RepID=A0ACB8BDZ2_9AGAM|nr:hypothetical protein BV22DRAFT_1036813 [Leucogyrophana mollusca]
MYVYLRRPSTLQLQSAGEAAAGNSPTSNTQQAFLVVQRRAPPQSEHCVDHPGPSLHLVSPRIGNGWLQKTHPRTRPYVIPECVVLIGGSTGFKLRL